MTILNELVQLIDDATRDEREDARVDILKGLDVKLHERIQKLDPSYPPSPAPHPDQGLPEPAPPVPTPHT